MHILISSKCDVDIRIVRVKLKLDDTIVTVYLQYSRYQSSQIFHIKLNDCKNLTFDTISFFLLNDRIFFVIIPLAKIMSLYIVLNRTISDSTLIELPL